MYPIKSSESILRQAQLKQFTTTDFHSDDKNLKSRLRSPYVQKPHQEYHTEWTAKTTWLFYIKTIAFCSINYSVAAHQLNSLVNYHNILYSSQLTDSYEEVNKICHSVPALITAYPVAAAARLAEPARGSPANQISATEC